MSDKTLNIITRDIAGKGAARSIRRDGKIPGIFYLKGEESVPLMTDEKELRAIISSKPALINLNFDDGSTKEGIIREVQRDPVTEEILHVDFMGITRGVKITATVPLVLTGDSEGVKLGGIVEQLIREVEVECLPKHLPDKVEIDISTLGIGSSLHISDLEMENIRFMARPEAGIVNIVLPKVVEVATEEEEEEEEAEVEGQEDAEETTE